MKKYGWAFFFLVLTGPVYAAEGELPVLGSIPEFRLTAQTGQPFNSADLQGKVWIADFIFTRCAGICPLMSGRMRGLQEKLASEDNLRLISFSVDPEYDTPEVLAKYALRFNAAEGRWFFLTGPKDEIFKLSQNHFMLGVGDVPEEERENAGQAVQHSSKFVLVDAAGQIRGFYDSEEQGAMDRLIRDSRTLTQSQL